MTVNVFFKKPAPARLNALAPLIRRIARAALRGKAPSGEINIVFVHDAEIKELNRKYLSHNRLTDVIAFNHPKPAFALPAGQRPFGDIYICLPQAARQAKKMGHSLNAELLILAAHGSLHLAGMDDGTPSKRRLMNLRTIALLKKTC